MRLRTLYLCYCLSVVGILLAVPAASAAPDPYLDHNGHLPARSDYAGPLFQLSHDYPSALPAPAMPWRAAIGNAALTVANAPAYTRALKDHVSRDMVALLAGDGGWDPGRRGWFNDPWLGPQREAIHGMLVGHERVDEGLFAKSGLSKPFTTYVVTYYNRTAAQTIGAIWRDPHQPQLGRGATQYAEGSITVKLAFTTAGSQEWPAMRGALSWPMMMTANATTGQFDRPTLARAYLMQVDIVVKDTQSAPQTGWVFTTLVYDRSTRPGSSGVWDQMVPLGAQWGNDPRVDSAANPGAPLFETWVNPKAPLYGTETLGWGGRLSGPNDHGVNDLSVVVNGRRSLVRRAANSSCLSCHGTSQWNAANPAKGMASFMMPLAPPAPGAAANAGAPYLNSPAPGSSAWLRWFQNRAGDVPMDAGSIPGDYDLALTFRVLPAWHEARSGRKHALQKLDAGGQALP